MRPSERRSDAVLVVAVRRRARPERSVLLVGVELRQQLGSRCSSSLWLRPRVEVDAEALERGLDLLAASPEPGRPSLRRARRRRRPGSRPRAAPPRAGRPRPTRGTGPSGRRSRCSSTRARPSCPPSSSRRATESPYAPLRAEATVIGPVGFAETISTWMRSRRLSAAEPNSSPASRISRERRGEPRRRSRKRLTKPGPATSARSTGRAAPRPRRARPRAPAAAAAARRRAAARRSSRSRRARPPPGARARAAPPRASAAASALTGSAGNGLARREEVFERRRLVRRADADEDVAGLDRRVGLRRRVEAAVRLAQARS